MKAQYKKSPKYNKTLPKLKKYNPRSCKNYVDCLDIRRYMSFMKHLKEQIKCMHGNQDR